MFIDEIFVKIIIVAIAAGMVFQAWWSGNMKMSEKASVTLVIVVVLCCVMAFINEPVPDFLADL